MRFGRMQNILANIPAGTNQTQNATNQFVRHSVCGGQTINNRNGPGNNGGGGGGNNGGGGRGRVRPFISQPIPFQPPKTDKLKYAQFGGKSRNMKKIKARRGQKEKEEHMDYGKIILKKTKRGKKQKPTQHMDYSEIILKKRNKKANKATETHRPLQTVKSKEATPTPSKPTKPTPSPSPQKSKTKRPSPASQRKVTKKVTRIFFTSKNEATPNTIKSRKTSRTISIPLFQSHCEAITVSDTLYASISMSISDAIATEYEIAAPVTEYGYNYKAAADQTGELSDGLRHGACAFGQTHSPHISYWPACPDDEDEDVIYHIANTNEYVKGEDIYSEVALLPLPIDTRRVWHQMNVPAMMIHYGMWAMN